MCVSSRLTCTCSGDPISAGIVLLHLGLTGIFLLKGLGSNPKGIVSHVQHLTSGHRVTVYTRMLRFEEPFERSLHFPNLKAAPDEFFVTQQIQKYIAAWLGDVGSALFWGGDG